MLSNPAFLLLIGIIILAATAVLFWPENGLLARWQQARQMTDRVRREDTLKHIYKCRQKGHRPGVESIAGALHISTNEVTELQEHQLTPEAANALSARLGHPTHDPHGDPIPSAAGDYVYHDGQPLNQLPVNTPARIVHLEDEPEVVYAQLVAEGLHPGQTVRLIEANGTRIRFWTNGDEHVLAPIVARNISVLPLPEEVEAETAVQDRLSGTRLSQLPLGETAEVIRISPNCRGAERRRFMDLGILPGTAVTAEMRSPSGEPPQNTRHPPAKPAPCTTRAICASWA